MNKKWRTEGGVYKAFICGTNWRIHPDPYRGLVTLYREKDNMGDYPTIAKAKARAEGRS